MTEASSHDRDGHRRPANQLTIAFDALAGARWGPLFQVLCIEQPGVDLRWLAVDLPTRERRLLDGADAGVYAAPPGEDGVSALTIEESQMLVVVAVGHPLSRRDSLSVADVLDEPFPGGRDLQPQCPAFWTLDEQRGAPPRLTDDRVESAEQALHVVASGRAIATVPATIAGGLPHPGVVALPLTDGPSVPTRLVWRTEDENPLVRSLVDLAADMTRGAPQGQLS
jgi:DNA-binding transcriptional LysR family regulator